MTAVQTALGPVEHDQLGMTLSHEHVFVGSQSLRHAYDWMFDHEANIEVAVAELKEAKAAGISTILDVTPPDLGRVPDLVVEVSRRSGVNIVVATGIWLDIPRAFRAASEDDIADLFVREIEVGLAEAPCRAGVIKVANGDPDGVGELQEKVLRGAARAAMRTRVPITTHTGPYTLGREQMRVFADEGIDPSLVAIGHSFTDDLDYLHEVLERGHYLSIDHFREGRDAEGVIRAVAQLCAEGHASRLQLGHDNVPVRMMSGYAKWDVPNAPKSPTGYTYVLREVKPALERLGVPAADIDTMLTTSMWTFLAGGRS